MVLTSTNATEEERQVYSTVMGKFNAFFQVRRNVIFERVRFNRQNQLLGETSEQCIMALYTLAANCNYGALEAEVIHDRLVVGIRDTSLSECLQLDPDLTLEKAKKAIHQREAVHKQQNILSGTDTPSLEAVHSYGRRRRTHDHRHDQQQCGNRAGAGKGRQKPTAKQCTRCGKEQHARDKCPTKDATCHKWGHYSTQCFAKNVSALSPETSGLDSAFLDAATSSSHWKRPGSLTSK